MRDNPEQEFLSAIHRHEPVTVQELCEICGVTATAIRQRLLRAQSEGWITRKTVRQERGRPCHTYSLTSEGLKQLGDDQGEMAAVLWREIMRIDQPEVRQRVLSGVRKALVQRFGVQAEEEQSLASRLQAMCATLEEFGFDVECETSQGADAESSLSRNLPVLREHNCPYHEIADEDPSFCDLEQSVFSEILGAPVELATCRLDGHRCCEFQVGTAVREPGQN